MADVVSEFSISVDQIQDFEFRVRFDKEHPNLLLDEPPPLGHDTGPNASRVLAAAIGNCLSASLLFCARKTGLQLTRIHTEIKVQVVRTESRRTRVGKVEVLIDPGIAEAERDHARRCLSIFEDYCTVTQSIRQGIPVQVSIKGFQTV